MTTVWLCIAATALASFTIKAIGPVLVGQREFPDRARGVIAMLAPALLMGLVVADILGPGWTDSDAGIVAGVSVALAARLCRAPMPLAVVAGVAATALMRDIT